MNITEFAAWVIVFGLIGELLALLHNEIDRRRNKRPDQRMPPASSSFYKWNRRKVGPRKSSEATKP